MYSLHSMLRDARSCGWTQIAMAAGLAAVGGCAVQSVADESLGGSLGALSLNSVTRESFDNQGRQGNGESVVPQISGNQQFVVFQSNATVWSPAVDTNGQSDIYSKDRNTGAITLISAANGVVGNAASLNPSVSDSGKVAFVSNTTNLAPDATAPGAKILLNSGGAISRVDIALTGQANGPASRAQISGDGNWVAFQSDATNLVAGDTNAVTDIYVRNLNSNQVIRASVTQSNTEPNGACIEPSISYDGRFVAFTCFASNMLFNDFNGVADVFVRDLVFGTTQAASFSTTGQGGAVGNGQSDTAQISGDGRHVVFRSFSTNWDPSDTNGVADIYVRDLGTIGAPLRTSVSSAGIQANQGSFQSAISFAGDAVAFVSNATNLVSGDTNGAADVFVHSRTTGQTVRVQRDAATQPNGSAVVNSTLRFSGNPSNPAFSFLAFDSFATNLTFSNDTNGVADVFCASLSP